MTLKPTTLAGDTEISRIAQQIRSATDYLINRHGYRLDEIRNLTGGANKAGLMPDGSYVKGEDRLHKNSVMKIRDLRVGWAVQQPVNKDEVAELPPESEPAKRAKAMAKLKKHWVEAPLGSVGFNDKPGRWQWMWNPQVDTFEKLERITTEACKVGFGSGPTHATRRAARTAA